VFNTKKDMVRLRQAAGYFTAGKTMEDFIWGTQLAQVVSMRHTMETARTRWPDCTGALLYKLNDNFPAASWSTVDWYGAAKIAHYFLQDVFAPLHACVLFDSVRQHNKAVELPVFVLDDADQLAQIAWQVNVRAYNATLQCVHTQSFEGRGATGTVKRLGSLALTAEQTRSHPLLIVAEVKRDGRLANRSFYFLNTDAAPDCLKRLPKTTLSLAVGDGQATVRNTGELPAVAATVLRLGQLDTFTASDNYFWLEPGESHTVDVSDSDGLSADAWNAAAIKQ
jgi:beta-mannosidase